MVFNGLDHPFPPKNGGSFVILDKTSYNYKEVSISFFVLHNT